MGSNPSRLTTNTKSPLDDPLNGKKGHLIDKNGIESRCQRLSPLLSCRCEESELATLLDALTAYRICAKADFEGIEARQHPAGTLDDDFRPFIGEPEIHKD